ncbi:MAG: polynucleotide adenylyltransferase [Campylobacterales bacterium]|nr:polynucleotide adenylyltransferase [Campylobacterales bacterium]
MEKKLYLVGGAVRDKLLGLEIYDKDYVAVGYEPKDFAHLKQVGKDFPIFLDENGNEIALARVEKKVGIGYGGFSVTTKNVTLQEDLSRRDLTINSIAYDENTCEYFDPFCGVQDLKRKVLRHTSQAFGEDPMRVLRLARFKAKLGSDWKIHHTTKVLVYGMKNELKTLQKDRVYKEIVKVFDTKKSRIFFETLFELGVLEDIFPSIYTLTTLKEGSVYHMESSCFEHTMCVLEKVQEKSILLQFCALYHDIAKPYCYRKFGNSSGHDNPLLVASLLDIQIPVKIKKDLLFIIQNHIKIAILDQMKASKIATFFESFRKRKDLLIDLLDLHDCDNHGRICFKPITNLDRKKIINTFDAINNYKVQHWLDTFDSRPSNEAIAQHIHKTNIVIINKVFFQKNI